MKTADFAKFLSKLPSRGTGSMGSCGVVVLVDGQSMAKTLSLHLIKFDATALSAYTRHVDTIYVYADGNIIKCTSEPNGEYAFTHDNKSYSLACDSSKKVRVTRIEPIDLASQYI